jgi:DNA-binding transcriptional ArsR family regulator
MDRGRCVGEIARRNGLSEETIMVHIKYQDVEQTFTGNVNDVWISVNRFFGEMIPALEAAQKAVLTVDLEKLIDDCKNIVAVAHEGPSLLVSRQKLTDSETLALHLLGAYIGNKLGLLNSDTLSKEELQTRIGKSAKIASTRLGELFREGLVTKTEEGKYKITTIGIRSLQEKTLPKIRERNER